MTEEGTCPGSCLGLLRCQLLFRGSLHFKPHPFYVSLRATTFVENSNFVTFLIEPRNKQWTQDIFEVTFSCFGGQKGCAPLWMRPPSDLQTLVWVLVWVWVPANLKLTTPLADSQKRLGAVTKMRRLERLPVGNAAHVIQLKRLLVSREMPRCTGLVTPATGKTVHLAFVRGCIPKGRDGPKGCTQRILEVWRATAPPASGSSHMNLCRGTGKSTCGCVSALGPGRCTAAVRTQRGARWLRPRLLGPVPVHPFGVGTQRDLALWKEGESM